MHKKTKNAHIYKKTSTLLSSLVFSSIQYIYFTQKQWHINYLVFAVDILMQLFSSCTTITSVCNILSKETTIAVTVLCSIFAGLH